MEVEVYRLNDGEKFEFSDVVGWKPDYSKYTKTNITLATFDEINNLSVGQYLVQITVPEDVEGNYAGLSKWLQFKIVPNQNEFTYNNSAVASYKYGEFNGSWRAPMSQFGEIKASVYRLEN